MYLIRQNNFGIEIIKYHERNPFCQDCAGSSDVFLSQSEKVTRKAEIDFYRQLNVDSEGRDYLMQNNSRAYFKILEYGTCNSWTHFVTLTIDPDKFGRYTDQQEVVKKITGYFADFKEKVFRDFRYLLVPELHEDGAVHFHGLVYAPDKVLPMKFFKYDKKTHKSIYHSEWFDNRVGFNQFIKIDEESEYCTYYITKYIQKSIEKICAHRYYVSQGLCGYKIVKNDYFVSGILADFVKSQKLRSSFSNNFIQKYQIRGVTIDNVLRDGLLLNDDQINEYNRHRIDREMRQYVKEQERREKEEEKRIAEGLPIFTNEAGEPLWITAPRDPSNKGWSSMSDLVNFADFDFDSPFPDQEPSLVQLCFFDTTPGSLPDKADLP